MTCLAIITFIRTRNAITLNQINHWPSLAYLAKWVHNPLNLRLVTLLAITRYLTAICYWWRTPSLQITSLSIAIQHSTLRTQLALVEQPTCILPHSHAIRNHFTLININAWFRVLRKHLTRNAHPTFQFTLTRKVFRKPRLQRILILRKVVAPLAITYLITAYQASPSINRQQKIILASQAHRI